MRPKHGQFEYMDMAGPQPVDPDIFIGQLCQAILIRLPDVPVQHIEPWVKENLQFFEVQDGRLAMKPYQMINFMCAQIDRRYRKVPIQRIVDENTDLAKEYQGVLEGVKIQLENYEKASKKTDKGQQSEIQRLEAENRRLRTELEKLQIAEAPKLENAKADRKLD